MLIRAKAPLRISFAGGGTDVPPFPEREGGAVLSATINRYAWGTLRPRDDQQIVISSLDLGESLSFSSHHDMTLDGNMGIARAAIRRMSGPDAPGFDLFLHADAAPGTGLGSSSAMMVVLVGLLRDFRQLHMTDYEIAHLAHELERVDLGIAGGMQDQYSAAFGGINHIEFFGDRVVVNGLRVGQDIVNELEYNLLLVDTGRSRLSSLVIEDQVRRYESGNADSVATLRELKRLSIEMKDRLLRRRWHEFGELLDQEWQHKKRMSDRISNPQLDELYDLARANGAIGGKITGAGGGGHMLLFCDFERKHQVQSVLEERGCRCMPVAMEQAGLQTWRVNES
jgi:D-glycero-alpha-D-manno-heptose-7-phosphate kinase